MAAPSAGTLKLKDYLLKERPPVIPSTQYLERKFGLQYVQVARQLDTAGYVKAKAGPEWTAPLNSVKPGNTSSYVLSVNAEVLEATATDELRNAIKARYKERGLAAFVKELLVMLAVASTQVDSHTVTVTKEGITGAQKVS